jgi:hypothetical protein
LACRAGPLQGRARDCGRKRGHANAWVRNEEVGIRSIGFSVICIVAGLATAAGAQAPSRAALQQASWGKAGVSLEDYRADAAACEREAVNLDISNMGAARTRVAASRAINAVFAGEWMYAPAASASGVGGGMFDRGGIGHDIQQVVHTYRVDEQLAEIAGLQYRVLQACLAGRGYRQFRLRADQAARLHRLRHGSAARRAYLHSLGSDPEIVSRQAL